LAAAAASALALCSFGVRADEPAQPTTSQEIQTLRTRLDQLEAQQKESDRQRQEAQQKLEDKVTSDELAKDTTRKDQLLTAEGFTAGYSENRFVIQSDDGNFVLRPWAHLQFRGVAEDRFDHQSTFNGPADQVDVGFEVRRMRFGVDGNMFSPDFTYFINWATSRTSGNANVTSTTGSTKGTTIGTVSNSLGGVPILEEAWVKYHIPATAFYLKAGQLKDPLLHDQIASSRYQHSAERSLTSDIFANGDGFTEGVTVIFDPDADFRAEAGVNHGLRSANSNFLSYPNNGSYNQFNYGFAGRAEYKVMGRWKDYSQVGAVGTQEQLLVIGTGADYSERGHDGQVVAVVDAMYADPSGLNFYGAFVDRYTTHNFGYYTQSPTGASINAGNPAIAGKPSNEYSMLAEVGYIFDHKIEPFARWEYMDLQGIPVHDRSYINVVTAGVNYYFQGHRLKMTGQIMYLPQGLPFDDGPSDELANTNGKTELVYEVQLQLLL
jgi:hypothetical protein